MPRRTPKQERARNQCDHSTHGIIVDLGGEIRALDGSVTKIPPKHPNKCAGCLQPLSRRPLSHES